MVAEARDRAVDHVRIRFCDGLVVNPELFGNAGPKRLDDDVSLRVELRCHGSIVSLIEIKRYAPFVGVDAAEIDAAHLVIRWIEATVVANLGLLHFDDIGTEIAKRLGTPWS